MANTEFEGEKVVLGVDQRLEDRGQGQGRGRQLTWLLVFANPNLPTQASLGRGQSVGGTKGPGGETKASGLVWGTREVRSCTCGHWTSSMTSLFSGEAEVTAWGKRGG